MAWKKIVFVAVFGILAAWLYQSDRFPEWSKDKLKHLILSPYEPYYVTFVLHWPISVCIFDVIEKRRGRGFSASSPEECRFPSQIHSWTILGIWSFRSTGSRCSVTPLRNFDVENITDDLNERWVQVKKYIKNFNFWEYEWNKHGTCLLDHPTLSKPSKYFQQAVKWHRMYDPTKALLACNIIPDDKKMYNNKQVITCLREQLNITTRIILSTKKDYTYRGGAVLLKEIKICFNKVLELTHCEVTNPFPIDFVYPRTVENK